MADNRRWPIRTILPGQELNGRLRYLLAQWQVCCSLMSMTTIRRTQQQRRDQAEAALLNAAAELIVEDGVHSLTLARVGERAGYSRGLVTHYFGSKQALLQRLAHATQSG